MLVADGRSAPLGPLPSAEIPPAPSVPLLDASATDPAWLATLVLLLASSPNSSLPVESLATQVRLLWSPDTLFVRFICQDTMIVETTPGPDGTIHSGDVVEVFIDPSGDGRHWFEIQANASGQVFTSLTILTTNMQVNKDGILVSEVETQETWVFPQWPIPGLRVTSRLTSDGWLVDLAIPASVILRRAGRTAFSGGEILRANFLRYDWNAPKTSPTRDFASLNWSAVLKGNPHRSPGRMGALRIVGEMPPRQGREMRMNPNGG
jgi:hypothetical protein